MNIREALKKAGEAISRRDAELLLAHALQQTRVWLLAHSEEEVTRDSADRFEQLVGRRCSGEPLQYILGEQEFFGLALQIEPGVLIPRPETEHLVEAVLTWADKHQPKLRVVDVGTGSGAISLALAKHLPQAAIIATDISAAALAVAARNASNLGFADQIAFRQSDLLAELGLRGLDIVVSNPPYVPSADAATMQKEVVEHEPHEALFAGDDGLDIYRRLIPQAQSVLRPGGLLAMEFGFGQQPELQKLLAEWNNVRFIDDYARIPRVVLAERA